LKRTLLFFLIFLTAVCSLWAEVRFAGLDLTANNLLLFKVRSDSPDCGAYDTLFKADLATGTLTQLTHFPERLVYLSGRKVLQLQNRFGVFHSAATFSDFQPYPVFDSFVAEDTILQGKLNPLALSPNGRYLLYLKPSSPAYGDLFLVDLQAESEQLVTKDIEIDLESTPVVWAPDSSFFVYSKDAVIYYISVRQLEDEWVIDESYRQIGEGRIGNMGAGREASLYYLSDSLVYELDSRELATRALYKGYLDIGSLVGKIPFKFDVNFDRFWISPQGTHILLNKGGRNLFLYSLSVEDFSSTGESQSLPYLYLPRNTEIARVLWSSEGMLTILTAGSENGTPTSRIYRLEVDGTLASSVFQRLELEGVQDLVLSPEQSTVAAVLADRLLLYDYATWAEVSSHPFRRPLQVVWVSEAELVIAGEQTTEVLQLESGQRRLLSISQPEEYSFSADETAVLARVGRKVYQWDLKVQDTGGQPGWRETEPIALRPPKGISDSYRVYLEDTPDRLFKNMVMIRDTERLGTSQLLDRQPPRLEPFPEEDEALDFVIFDHGSRIRRRELSLAFNVVDSVEGLPIVLSTLESYGLRCTFFVNGEAIRSYPDAVREIAGSGHEVGSLFSIHFNMTDSRFKLDREFIKRGLAQNEDEYHQATGKELSLLWHAPYYFVNSDIVQVSREMNYTYVGRDVDPLDWVTREMSLTTENIYLSSSRLVERIIDKKKPGSIVPILVGVPETGREDYFFQRLDLLVDGLIKRGYEIVPVSTLIEHAE